MNCEIKGKIRFLLLAACAWSFAGVCSAQYQGPALVSPPRVANAPDGALNVAYGDVRIEPGDTISIATFGAPELTTTAQTAPSTFFPVGSGALQGVKVGANGEVALPYLGVVKLAGLTPVEASALISQGLKDGGFLTDPQVTVQLVDSPTRSITVIGEVMRPTPVPAFGHIRLLDAISACGGFTPLASHEITVRRRGYDEPIVVDLGTNARSANLTDIPLMPGDTVIVSKVGSVYVLGQVKTPNSFPLSSNAPVTVMRAVAMSGGALYGAALSKVRIIRTTPDNQHVEIMVDLGKIQFGKQQDIALVSDDVLFVPTNAFKAALAAGAAGVAASAIYGVTYAASVLK
jgi:polysaccharide export outer membrane protein